MKVETNKIYHADNAKFMPNIPDGSIDVILEDPPYLYLKNQKLDRPFDELAHFTECYRMLREGGFIVIFGRGESFYRWNTILANLGFTFKEEIIWNKVRTSSPVASLSRVHETVAIWSKGNQSINKVRIPYLEVKGHDIDGIITDINRIKIGLNNPVSFVRLKEFLLINKNRKEPLRLDTEAPHKPSTTLSGKSTSSRDRSVNCMQSLEFGFVEKSIMQISREHYNTIHPTQKPPRLLERLLALVVPKNKPLEEIVVADFFGGSCNTAKACISMGVNYIVTEIDKEFYDKGVENVETFKEEFQPSLFN